jgi:hypothetical protein
VVQAGENRGAATSAPQWKFKYWGVNGKKRRSFQKAELQ